MLKQQLYCMVGNLLIRHKEPPGMSNNSLYLNRPPKPKHKRTLYQTKLCESAKQVALIKTESVIIRFTRIYLYKPLHNLSQYKNPTVK